MGKGVVLSNKGGILLFRLHTHGVESCDAYNYSSFKMTNVEWAENYLTKFGV